MPSEWKSNVWGFISIGATLFALVNKEDRLLTSIILIGAIVFYIVYSFSDDLDKHEEEIKKLEEKLKIHEQLVNIKGDITYLMREVPKK